MENTEDLSEIEFALRNDPSLLLLNTKFSPSNIPSASICALYSLFSKVQPSSVKNPVLVWLINLVFVLDPYLQFLKVTFSNLTSPLVIINALPVTLITALFSAAIVRL